MYIKERERESYGNYGFTISHSRCNSPECCMAKHRVIVIARGRDRFKSVKRANRPSRSRTRIVYLSFPLRRFYSFYSFRHYKYYRCKIPVYTLYRRFRTHAAGCRYTRARAEHYVQFFYRRPSQYFRQYSCRTVLSLEKKSRAKLEVGGNNENDDLSQSIARRQVIVVYGPSRYFNYLERNLRAS